MYSKTWDEVGGLAAHTLTLAIVSGSSDTSIIHQLSFQPFHEKWISQDCLFEPWEALGCRNTESPLRLRSCPVLFNFTLHYQEQALAFSRMYSPFETRVTVWKIHWTDVHVPLLTKFCNRIIYRGWKACKTVKHSLHYLKNKCNTDILSNITTLMLSEYICLHSIFHLFYSVLCVLTILHFI